VFGVEYKSFDLNYKQFYAKPYLANLTYKPPIMVILGISFFIILLPKKELDLH
jgi:hypothetical protein